MMHARGCDACAPFLLVAHAGRCVLSTDCGKHTLPGQQQGSVSRGHTVVSRQISQNYSAEPSSTVLLILLHLSLFCR